MNEIKDHKELLKHEGLKNTKHRNAILSLMENCDQPISAEDLYIKLKNEKISINLSSVYRILESLVSKGIIIKSNTCADMKAVFELNRLEHKHHLICKGCKKMISVDGCPLEEYEKELQRKSGFSIIGHNLEIFGLCDKCKQAK